MNSLSKLAMGCIVKKESTAMVSPERKSESNKISLRYEKLPVIVNLTDSSCDIGEDDLFEDRNETNTCSGRRLRLGQSRRRQAKFTSVGWEITEEDDRNTSSDETMDDGANVEMSYIVDNLQAPSIWNGVHVNEVAWQEEDKHLSSKAIGKKGNHKFYYPAMTKLDAYLHLPLSSDEEAPTSQGLPSNGETFGLWLPCYEISTGSYEKGDDDVSLLYDDPDIDDLGYLPQSTFDVLHSCLDDWSEDWVDSDVGSDSDSEVDEKEVAKTKMKEAKKLLKKMKREEKKNRKKNWIQNYSVALNTLSGR